MILELFYSVPELNARAAGGLDTPSHVLEHSAQAADKLGHGAIECCLNDLLHQGLQVLL
jgi:phosphoribosylaminoimidazole (AIR) synthetase